MTQIKILLADSDENYLLPLEKSFIDYYAHSAELHLITDLDYLEQFFSEPQTFDILVIDEKLYNESFSRHNIQNTFLLTERKAEAEAETTRQPLRMYKYRSAKEILNYVVRRSGVTRLDDSRRERGKLIMVYSPVGGSGQTTVAQGITAAMKRSLSRAIYVSGDSLQAPVETVGDKKMPPGIEKSVRGRSSYTYDKIRPFIIKGCCDAVPVFPASLTSLGMDIEDTLFLCEAIRDSGDYDYVVLDGGSGLSQGVTKAMAAADYVILVTNQDRISNRKLAALLMNIDCSDDGRYMIVCNKYAEDELNFVRDCTKNDNLTVAYVEKTEAEADGLINKISQLASMKKVVQLLM